MSAAVTLTVDEAGLRLDRFVAQRCPELSRTRIQALIESGHVTVEGKAARPSDKLKQGQIVTVIVPPAVASAIEPQQIPLKVVYEDSDLLVIDKPAGLTVHPAPGHADGTLVNAILAICPDLRGIGGTVRPGIVHRLDKDTSGLLVVAKHDAAHQHLTGQLQRREFNKVYLALVKGTVKPAEAIIEAPVGRDPTNRKKMAVVTSGRHAITRYRAIRYYEGYTLLEVRLVTGRTHQIRVHTASIGYPVAGDTTYGQPVPELARQFLHATRLGFRLPSSGEQAEFESKLPPDLESFLDWLEIRSGTHVH